MASKFKTCNRINAVACLHVILASGVLFTGAACNGAKSLTKNVTAADKSEAKRPVAQDSGIFLKAADFDLSKNQKKIAKSQLLRELSQESALYNSMDDQDESSTDTTECDQDPASVGKVSAQKNRLEIRYQDQTKCLPKEASIFSQKAYSLDYQVYVLMECEGVDFSKYDGMSQEEFEKTVENDGSLILRCNDGDMRQLINMRMDLQSVAGDKSTSKTNTDGSTTTTIAIPRVRYSYANLNSQDEACVEKKSGNQYVQSDCIEWSLSEFGDDLKYAEVQKLHRKEIIRSIIKEYDPTQHWYGGGSIDVNFADWQGTITYSAFDKPGKYILTNGRDQMSGDLPRYQSIAEDGSKNSDEDWGKPVKADEVSDESEDEDESDDAELRLATARESSAAQLKRTVRSMRFMEQHFAKMLRPFLHRPEATDVE